MKLLLCAINAKYIHSNLAVYSLKTYSREAAEKAGWDVKIKEYTINHYEEDILRDIYREKADVVVFSCYIWNISMVFSISEDLKQAAPNTAIWLGGPEVSYDAKKVLKNHPEISLVMIGEGEKTFASLLRQKDREKIPGIVWRKEAFDGKSEEIVENGPVGLLSMDEIPFVYDNLGQFEHKILYYETSRGCPFSCSYCLSSIDKSVRLRSFSLVQKELDFFLEHKVPQVKLVDRTFNCNKVHSRQIWQYLLEHDNGVTNFHFEVSADLIEEEDLRLMEQMRPGLIQLEIGVQSTNTDTIRAIRRTMDLTKLKDRVARVKAMGNIHQHLDLIAGLPYEDFSSFVQSFCDVYAMEPDQLQLGFLKVLKGSYMEEAANQYNLIYRRKPVYEVISTKWISYDEILLLKDVEEMVEIYYNSAQFRWSLLYLIHFVENPFLFYEKLAGYYKKTGLGERKHNRISRYTILLEFAEEENLGEPELLKEILTYDLYLRENMKSRPVWSKDLKKWNKIYTEFFRDTEKVSVYLEQNGYDSKKAARQNHIEPFSFDIRKTARAGKKEGNPCHILFDYENRDPLTADARTVQVEF